MYKTSSKARVPTFLFLFVIKLLSMALTVGEAKLKSHLGSTTKHDDVEATGNATF